MNPTDDRAEHQLDAWLATARSALDNALVEMLDLDAGLADAQLPGRHAALTHALDDVLDLEAGLDQIVPTHHQPSPPPDPTPHPKLPMRRTALGRFADRFAALPLPERLTARTWLPLHELADVQSTTRRHLVRVRARDGALDRALARACTRALARALALAHALEVDAVRGHGPALAHALEVARALEVTLGLARAHGLADALARTRVHARALDRALGLGRARVLVLVLDLAIALNRDRDLARARAHDRDHELVQAMDRVETAITNMADADLSQMDLTGIPLDGLRWSDRTRWPEGWRGEIQDNSIELEPGLYEIRFGGVASNHTIDTPI